jgi:hypothetical protein
MIEVEGTIFAFEFSKKYDLSLLSIEGRVLDRCRAFDRLASVDAQLCTGVRRQGSIFFWSLAARADKQGPLRWNVVWVGSMDIPLYGTVKNDKEET